MIRFMFMMITVFFTLGGCVVGDAPTNTQVQEGSSSELVCRRSGQWIRVERHTLAVGMPLPDIGTGGGEQVIHLPYMESDTWGWTLPWSEGDMADVAWSFSYGHSYFGGASVHVHSLYREIADLPRGQWRFFNVSCPAEAHFRPGCQNRGYRDSAYEAGLWIYNHGAVWEIFLSVSPEVGISWAGTASMSRVNNILYLAPGRRGTWNHEVRVGCITPRARLQDYQIGESAISLVRDQSRVFVQANAQGCGTCWSVP